jgi:hypothetical protein
MSEVYDFEAAAKSYSEFLFEQEKKAPPLLDVKESPDGDDDDEDIDDDEVEDESDDTSENDSDAAAMVASASSSNGAALSGESEGAEMSALRKMLLDEAAEDSEAGRRAKKALMAYDAPSEDEKEPEKPEPKPEAVAEEPDSDEKKEEPKASGRAALAMAARLQALEAAESKRVTTAERAQLMASRPDLSTEVVAWLSKQPLAIVRSAVKELPIGNGKGGQVASARAAMTATPTLGAAAASAPLPAGLPGAQAATNKFTNASGEGDLLDSILGLGGGPEPVQMNGNRMSLHVVSNERAREYAKKVGAQ